MPIRSRAFLILYLSLTVLGCGSSRDSPTEPEDFGNLSGTWQASVSTPCGTSGSIAARVTQAGAAVEIAVPGVGSALGFLDRGVIVGTLSLSACSGSATGALVVSPGLLAGSFSGALTGTPPGCCGSQPVSVRLTR